MSTFKCLNVNQTWEKKKKMLINIFLKYKYDILLRCENVVVSDSDVYILLQTSRKKCTYKERAIIYLRFGRGEKKTYNDVHLTFILT